MCEEGACQAVSGPTCCPLASRRGRGILQSIPRPRQEDWLLPWPCRVDVKRVSGARETVSSLRGETDGRRDSSQAAFNSRTALVCTLLPEYHFCTVKRLRRPPHKLGAPLSMPRHRDDPLTSPRANRLPYKISHDRAQKAKHPPAPRPKTQAEVTIFMPSKPRSTTMDPRRPKITLGKSSTQPDSPAQPSQSLQSSAPLPLSAVNRFRLLHVTLESLNNTSARSAKATLQVLLPATMPCAAKFAFFERRSELLLAFGAVGSFETMVEAVRVLGCHKEVIKVVIVDGAHSSVKRKWSEWRNENLM